jgi:multidrug efflux system outer membrane protein
MSKSTFLSLACAALATGGCKMAPAYVRPAAPVPAEWPQGAGAEAARAAGTDWRSVFTDARLQQVIGLALTNSPDLRLAALNAEQARELYGIQRSELLPIFKVTGSGSKESQPADLSSSGSRQTVESYSVKLGVASWEPDFFGRLRSLKDRALEEYLASEEARRSAELLLVSSVASACLALAADRESLALAETTLAAQQDAFALIKRRLELGLATQLDLSRAQTQVDASRVSAAELRRQAAQDENALNLLAGAAVPRELLPARLSDVEPPLELRAGLPSEVLLRRPDVLQAEHLLKSANANIGAARAAFFPSISLTAALGTSSAELSGLFKAGSGTWSYAPQIAVPVFDARTWSAYRATRVQQRSAVAAYERAIQRAFREVADALAVRSTLDEQLAAQSSLVDAVADTYRLSSARYERGVDSYLSVLDAQRSLYSAQQGLVALRFAKLANRIQLYAALGEVSQGGPAAP